MPTTGQFIRSSLIRAGGKGCVSMELFRERKDPRWGVYHKNGTFYSWSKLWNVLVRLEWITLTGETEAAFIKGTTTRLARDRQYYSITPKGITASDDDWTDPLGALYPHWRGSKRRIKYFPPTGGRRGRPRTTDKG